MNGIGFRNFRRFKELNSLPLGGINLFVGGNNAGKSTVVKGLLLLLDFLKNQKISSSNLFETPKFRFDGPGAHDVNIDTFNRALCWNSKEKEIVFFACIEDFEVEVCIYNDSPKEDVGYAFVKSIKLEDKKTGLGFMFDVNNAKTLVSYSSDEQKETLQKQIEELEKDLDELNKEISKTSSSKSSEEGEKKLFDRMAQKSHLETKLKEYRKSLRLTKKTIQLRIQQSPSINVSYIFSYLQGIIEFVDVATASTNNNYTETNELSPKELSWLKQHIFEIQDINTRFDHAVQKISVEYLYSHNANQRVIYNKKDENDYVSKSIYEIYNQRITSKSEIGKKVLSWLKDFCAVDDYKVTTIQGEAYQFVLKSNGKWIDLADMGRGVIQLVILFVRLASIIKKYQGKTDAPIVLIEEPEQNLHPALQSKLTDLLYQIYDEFGIRFIVETHSEYVVRKSQVVVYENIKIERFTLDNNPFKVYFFDEKEGPYQMVYRENGRFSNEFNSSFYNEASNLAFELF